MITVRFSDGRYKSTPEEVAAACDVTFAMLADPESAVSMFVLDVLMYVFENVTIIMVPCIFYSLMLLLE